MTGLIVRLLRLASFVICLIVLASFVIFAAGQTKTASKHQTEEITGGANVGSGSSGTTTAHESSLHREIDEASEELTSPFAGVVSGLEQRMGRPRREAAARARRLRLRSQLHRARAARQGVALPLKGCAQGPASALTRALPPPSSLYTSTGVPVRTHA